MNFRKTLLSMSTLMIVGTTIFQGKAPAASSVRIAIAAAGVDGKIAAHVETNGNVTIEEYPAHFEGSVKVLTMASPIFGRVLSDAACQAVADRAELAASDAFPADLRKIAQDNVRKDNSFTLEAAVASFFATSAFTEAAKAAAIAAGVQASSYQITNPLTGRAFDIGLEFTDDALSRKIGDIETLTRQVKVLLQTSGGFQTGTSQGEVSAADLVCDLRAGHVKITTKVLGSIEAGSRVEPLYDAAIAQALYDGLKAQLAETSDNYTVSQKLVVAGVAVGDVAKAAGAGLDARRLGVIAEKLFEARTGNLVAVPAGRIQQVLAAQLDGGLRFEGQGPLVFHQ